MNRHFKLNFCLCLTVVQVCLAGSGFAVVADRQEQAEAQRWVAAKFSGLSAGPVLNELPAPEASLRVILRHKKALEQVQICLGVPAPPITDENRYVSLILNTVLGGGMSSRLF